MNAPPTSRFDHLWNDLPYEERHRMMPHMMETHILHLYQSRLKVVQGHKRTLAEIDSQIKNIRKDLDKLKADT